MTYTDTQLKQALAKMLPGKIIHTSNKPNEFGQLNWMGRPELVLDTELLHLCWLVEETIDTLGGWLHFNAALLFIVLNQFKHFDLTSHQQFKLTHATWQQRVIALAKVKGVEL